MSLRWVESTAPLLDQECVLEALAAVKANFHEVGDRIEVAIFDGPIVLHRRHGAYVIRRRQDAAHVEWERRLVVAYERARGDKLARLAELQRQQEEQRREEARQKLVEERKTAIVARAKSLGFSVKEELHGEEIQLVFVRRSY